MNEIAWIEKFRTWMIFKGNLPILTRYRYLNLAPVPYCCFWVPLLKGFRQWRSFTRNRYLFSKDPVVFWNPVSKNSPQKCDFFCYTWSLANRLNIRYSIWQYKPVGRAVLRYRDWLQKILMSAEYQMMLSFKNVCTTNFWFLDSVWRMMISIWH